MDWQHLLNTGRPRKTSSTGDHREQFERDYDRAVFSTPVKRLQDKAQVFPLETHDAVRTRLTHSLEVSSVARGLAKSVAAWLKERKEINQEWGRSIEAIAATCGLIHDLGNPPFGHSGEDAIREWFGDKSRKVSLERELGGDDQLIEDFLLFEGNAQSLRLVSKLQVLADFNGLNLTFGTLSASCKYIAASHEADTDSDDHARTKPGYFASEKELVERIRSETRTGNARNPITFLAEAADDIVYSVADIEDGVKKGVLPWRDLKEEIESQSDSVFTDVLKETKRILKAGRAEVPPDLPDDIWASAFRTATIGILVHSCVDVFKENYDAIMEGAYKHELVQKCKASSLVRFLKEIGPTRVYCTQSTLKLELMGRTVIKDLLTAFWEGARDLPTDREPKTKIFSGKVGALLSQNYRTVFRHSVSSGSGLPDSYWRYRLLTDYVCGMTDSFAKRLHGELTNRS